MTRSTETGPVIDYLDTKKSGCVVLCGCELGGRNVSHKTFTKKASEEPVIDLNLKYFEGSTLLNWYTPKEPVKLT